VGSDSTQANPCPKKSIGSDTEGKGCQRGKGVRYPFLRFRDPLLVPYVFMNAVDANLISGETLVQMLEETH